MHRSSWHRSTILPEAVSPTSSIHSRSVLTTLCSLDGRTGRTQVQRRRIGLHGCLGTSSARRTCPPCHHTHWIRSLPSRQRRIGLCLVDSRSLDHCRSRIRCKYLSHRSTRSTLTTRDGLLGHLLEPDRLRPVGRSAGIFLLHCRLSAPRTRRRTGVLDEHGSDEPHLRLDCPRCAVLPAVLLVVLEWIRRLEYQRRRKERQGRQLVSSSIVEYRRPTHCSQNPRLDPHVRLCRDDL
jgi:hypothetical protein